MSSTCCSELIFNYNIEHPALYAIRLTIDEYLISYFLFIATWSIRWLRGRGKGFVTKIHSPAALNFGQKFKNFKL